MAGFKNGTLVAKNGDFTQVDGPNSTSSENNGLVTDGKIWIGSTALNVGGTHINVGSITSPLATVTIGYTSPNITIDVSGATVGQTITGNTGGPLSPVAGNWNIFGAASAAGTTPVSTAGSGNTLTLNVQRSQAIASTNLNNIGLAAFNSTQFSVDANGFVSASGTGIGQTITGDSGGALSPTAGNWNLLGSGSITTSGAGSTLTTQLTGLTNHAVLVGAGTTTITKVGPTATAGQVLQSAGSSADPAFSTATYPLTTTVSQILYSSATNVVSGLATANRAVVTTNSTGVPVVTALATDGQLIIGSTAGAPAAASLTAGTGISITPGSNSITIAATGGGVTAVTGQAITATGAFTYTPTSGMKYVIVELVGGGGGSGGTSVAVAGGSGGGGGGGYARFILTAAQVGASLSGSVGAGGAGGAAGGNNGNNGASTTLATTAAWTAAGGSLSVLGTSTFANGGAGGAVTTGTGTVLVTIDGGTGSPSSAPALVSGTGGYSGLGIGGVGSASDAASVTGAVGKGYGAGGGGSRNAASANTAGAAGTNGIAIFTEFN